MSEKGPSKEPFELKDESAPFESRTRLREFKDNPNKIVREEMMINDSINDSIRHYANVRKQFESLQSEYGVNVPGIDVVIGENDREEKKVFMVVDKIEGENLEEIKSLPEDSKEKLEKFYVGVLESMLNAYKKEEAFLGDVAPRNLVYGHEAKEQGAEDDFYLVDVGHSSFVEREGQYKEEDDYKFAFFSTLTSMVEDGDIKVLEMKFGKDARLSKVRDRFKQIYEFAAKTQLDQRPDNWVVKKSQKVIEAFLDNS